MFRLLLQTAGYRLSELVNGGEEICVFCLPCEQHGHTRMYGLGDAQSAFSRGLELQCVWTLNMRQ